MLPLSEVVLIVMGLLTVAIIAAGLFRALPVPFTVVLVVAGMVLSEAARHVDVLAPLGQFRLSPDIVFFLFLPALIFESGFTLDARQLVKDLAPVLVLAVPALLVSTAVVGFALWGLLGIDLVVALLFGALISATDPVAVVALFKEIGAPLRLNVLVEGESLLNDATAIVLFGIILALAMDGGEFSGAGLGWAVLDFLRVFLGGAVVGLLVGMLASELLYRLRSNVSAILAMSVVMAYASFIIAEHLLHVSGVMASASAAVALGLFGVARLRHEATDAIGETWELIALVCNSLLFLMIGMSVDLTGLLGRLDQIALAIVLVLAARAATVYTLVPATTRLFSLPTVPMAERTIMWWGGLKGGLAVAIALSIPDSLPGRQLLLDMTLGVVLFTLLVNAPTIRPLMSRLGLDRMTPDERAELKHALEDAREEAGHALDRYTAAHVIDAGAGERIVGHIDSVLRPDAVEDAPEQRRREAFLVAVRAEMEALDELYNVGAVTQYTYLDLRTLLRRDRERSSGGKVVLGVARGGQGNLFLRFERALLGRLRERNWAAGMLSRYQSFRMAQHLEHNIAGILMARAGIAALGRRRELDDEVRAALTGVYEERLARRQSRLAVIRRDFTDFYTSFTERLTTRVALNAAQLGARHQLHAGEIGAKAFAAISRDLAAALEHLPPVTSPQPRLSAAHLIDMVPLFHGVSERALEGLAARAQMVTFLPGDIIIGEGDRGSALYIITQGRVTVDRIHDGAAQHLGDLETGDFFGEAALLGDEVRTASVRASVPCTMLRLARRDVLDLAADHAEVATGLERVRERRIRDDRAMEPRA